MLEIILFGTLIHTKENVMRYFFKVFLAVAMISFATSAYASGLNSARIMPKGHVAVFQEGQKIAEFSREAPLPEGSLLSCSGKCGVKMDHLYFVAIDGSRFSVTSREGVRILNIEKGTIHFVLSALPETLVFKTKHGTFTTDEIMLNASTGGGYLQGYVSVTSEETQLGVIEGGSMLISTVKGNRLVQPGNRIIMAQAKMGPGGGSGDFVASANTRLLTRMVPPAVTAAIILDALLDSDNDGEGSPFIP